MAEKRRDKDGRILPENVTQRKDGSYMWRKSINGKPYCIYAKTLGEIKQKRNLALGEIEQGTYRGKHEKMREEKEAAKKDITLNEWFLQWERAYRKGSVRETTLQNGHTMYMGHFADNIGKMKVKDIKQIHIVSIYKEMKERGVKYSSIKRYNDTLILVLESAIKNNLLIGDNPARGALAIPKDPISERRVLSEEEENIFFDFITNNRYYRKRVAFFMVGFNTGMRIGEILALTWDDIDFENNVIHVNKTLVRLRNKAKECRFAIHPPKTQNSIRDIPMLKNVRQSLVEQKQENEKCNVVIDGHTDFIFLSKTGGVIYDTSIRETIHHAVKQINKREQKKAKEENRDAVVFEYFSPHCMRHTFATRCYEKGIKEKVIQKVLGHAKLDMTLNVYTHVTNEMIEDDIRKLEG